MTVSILDTSGIDEVVHVSIFRFVRSMMELMARLFFIGIILLTLLGTIGYFKFAVQPKQAVRSQASQSNVNQEATPSSSFIPAAQRLDALEAAVAELQKKTGTTPQPNKTASKELVTGGTQELFTTLEQKVSNLDTRVSKLEKNVSATSAPNTKTLYIPLGTTGSATTRDWSTVSTLEVGIDTANYPNYKTMQLEVSLRIYQGNGTAYARLLNYTEGTAMLGSEVSTTSQDYNWVTSSTFVLPGGQRTYRLQLKTSTGYSADIQSARIKVNF